MLHDSKALRKTPMCPIPTTGKECPSNPTVHSLIVHSGLASVKMVPGKLRLSLGACPLGEIWRGNRGKATLRATLALAALDGGRNKIACVIITGSDIMVINVK